MEEVKKSRIAEDFDKLKKTPEVIVKIKIHKEVCFVIQKAFRDHITFVSIFWDVICI